MVDIQMKILDIQTASPAKHSLFIKTEETLIKKVWPGTSMCTMSDSDINSSRFVLKLGNNSIGEVPLVEFTKEWIHSSKEIHGFRISLAYRVLLKRTEKQKDRQTDKINNESFNELIDQYTKTLEAFKAKEKDFLDKLEKVTNKKNKWKNHAEGLKLQVEKIESELWTAKEELKFEKTRNKVLGPGNSGKNEEKNAKGLQSGYLIHVGDKNQPGKSTSTIGKIEKVEELDENSPKEDLETLKSENSFRFSFGPDAGSEDFEKNLEMILNEILEEKGIEQNILQVSTGIFYIGKVRVQVKIADGEVLAYYKKSYIPIDEFLDVHFQQKKEPRRSISAERFRIPVDRPAKLETKKQTQAKNLNSSMKIVQDIDKVLEYSNFFKSKY